MAVETEIKLRVAAAEDARELLERHGYGATGSRRLEVDQLYDRSTGELRQADQVLRVRTTDGRATLTYKGPAARAPYKSREEIELDLSDGPAFEQVLARLGYLPAFRYEKYRTNFRAPGQPGLVTLDETPIGAFLELEGPGDWIDATAVQLGFSAADYIVASYATLYREYCRGKRGQYLPT